MKLVDKVEDSAHMLTDVGAPVNNDLPAKGIQESNGLMSGDTAEFELPRLSAPGVAPERLDSAWAEHAVHTKM